MHIDTYTFNSFSAMWENGGIFEFADTLFSAMSECQDINCGEYVIPVQAIGVYGSFATTFVKDFVVDSVGVQAGDTKITITIAGLPKKTISFYFREGEDNYFEVKNEDIL